MLFCPEVFCVLSFYSIVPDTSAVSCCSSIYQGYVSAVRPYCSLAPIQYSYRQDSGTTTGPSAPAVPPEAPATALPVTRITFRPPRPHDEVVVGVCRPGTGGHARAGQCGAVSGYPGRREDPGMVSITRHHKHSNVA